jgi:serine/threonine-protein kinase
VVTWAHPRAAEQFGDRRYRSLFAIGRGGMGSVDVAIEEIGDGTRRIVALKRLLPDTVRDPRRTAMFLSEARIAALLAHPNVVRAFAFGELGDELFLAMEYVEGQTLSRVLAAPAHAAAGLDPRIAAHILADVCEGLHAAHELRDEGGRCLNVVHRDVSPHNVMIAYEGHVKILDFGVAKFDAARNQTRTGEVKGKMAYMSPEQALGEPLDRRSDLFGIGAVLFECVVGRPMWGSGTDLEVMRKLALEQPPRLDEARPDVAPALAALHARLVARDPSRRPASARLVADDLRAAATGVDRARLQWWMESMFAAEAEEQRGRVARAIEAAEPLHAQELRRSMSVAGIAVPSPPGKRADRRSSRWASIGAALAGGLVGAVALVGFANGGRRSAPAAAPSSTGIARGVPSDGRQAPPAAPVSAATAPASTAPTPALAAAPEAPVQTSAAVVPAADATATVPATRPDASPETAHRNAAPSRDATRHPGIDHSAPKLPDVDPTPF